MDLTKVLEQLRRELENLDVAILTLERLQERGVPRGRRPKILAELRDPPQLKSPNSASVPRRSRRNNQPS
jgi:hypothetical protein